MKNASAIHLGMHKYVHALDRAETNIPIVRVFTWLCWYLNIKKIFGYTYNKRLLWIIFW